MTLVDSSVWIDFLRASGSVADEYVKQRLGQSLAVTEPVQMEVMAGVPRDSVERVLRLLDSQEPLPVEPDVDYLAAAALYRECRRLGRTIRSLNDCLIAGVALRTKATLVHKDADFDVIAEVSGLDVVSLR
ncbi:MAG: type II toxin-antitoxin system VapC family toxin [Marmoricola sp.]